MQSGSCARPHARLDQAFRDWSAALPTDLETGGNCSAVTTHSETNMKILQGIPLLLVLLGGALLVFRSATVPPLFFDEGWYLETARNWVESGHYGPKMNGRPFSASMITAGCPAIMPLALSFRAFGIGLWQARLPGILFTAGSVALLWVLAGRLYSKPIATWTLAVLLFMPIHPELHPILIGRQALGEMPALFYVLAGYSCLLAGGGARRWLRPIAPAWWGLALATKPQVIPFLFAALLLPLALSLRRHAWAEVRMITRGLIGSVAVLLALTLLQRYVLHDPRPPQTHMGDWYGTTAVIPLGSVRSSVLSWTVLFALPTLAGLAYAGYELAIRRQEPLGASETGMARLSLLVLSSSWLVWYVFLSVGFMRYLFPSTFLASVFVAHMLHSLTDGFAPVPLSLSRKSASVLFALALIAWTVPLTLYGLFRSYRSDRGDSVGLVASFVNSQTPPDAVIETGEAEIFFLLERRYVFGLERFPVSLPLDTNADYLVIGPMVKAVAGDREILGRGHFKPVTSFGPYDIYRRRVD